MADEFFSREGTDSAEGNGMQAKTIYPISRLKNGVFAIPILEI